MIPIMFTGLGVCVMFSANEFNLGGEGCVMVGGFVGALCAIYIPMPAWIHPAFCVLMSMLVCGAIMLIPSLLKVKLGASEMVCTLMLNYIMLYTVKHFLTNVFADRSKGQTQTAQRTHYGAGHAREVYMGVLRGAGDGGAGVAVHVSHALGLHHPHAGREP